MACTRSSLASNPSHADMTVTHQDVCGAFKDSHPPDSCWPLTPHRWIMLLWQSLIQAGADVNAVGEVREEDLAHSHAAHPPCLLTVCCFSVDSVLSAALCPPLGA